MQQSLAERVLTVFQEECPGQEGALDYLCKEPGHFQRGALTEFELDLRDWGFAFGLAYALARSEGDPFESRESVGRRALEAARQAIGVYGSGWHQRGEVTPPDAVLTPIGGRS